jgi:hypothetical protein
LKPLACPGNSSVSNFKRLEAVAELFRNSFKQVEPVAGSLENGCKGAEAVCK